ILLSGHMPHGPKPGRQGQMTVLKDRTRSDRHLVSALATAPAGAPNRPRRLSRAPRTHPAGGPAHRGKIAGAGLIAAESLLQLQQSPRIILAHARKHYILGLVASSKYPYESLPLAFCQTAGVLR